MATFDSISTIPSALLETLKHLNFTTMTQIQEKAIPVILAQKDVLAQSKTGSGKTVAFGIPLIIHTDTNCHTPQHLIITPTRELAQQVAEELRRLSVYKSNLKILTLYGGVPLRTQADSLAKGAHILIGTPGRLQDHLEKGTLALKGIKTLVLDEADRMLDMGFYNDILKISSAMPKKKQTLLFSATFPQKIETLAKTLLHDPDIIKVDTVQEAQKIKELVYTVDNKQKALIQIIHSFKPESLLIFCNTKADVITLAAYLHTQGHDVIDLHGDLDQRERNEAVILFSNATKRIMVATDVASRGLDIKGIDLVINYDLPFDQEVYMHRIGRTGRADATGKAVSFYMSGSQKTAYIFERAQERALQTLNNDPSFTMTSPWGTLCINGGKKTKLRAGDILGTLCKEVGIDNTMIGKITITENRSYIVLHSSFIEKTVNALKHTKIKKKRYVAWRLERS